MTNFLKSIALLIAFAGASPLTAQSAADEQAVLAVIQEVGAAFDAFDADRFAVVYTENATLINPLGGIITGRENIRKVHADLFKRWGGKPNGRSSVSSDPKVRFLTPDLAWVVLTSTVTYSREGKTLSESSTICGLFSQMHGKWLAESIQLTPVTPFPGK